jgi:hypothetical protein
MNTLVFAIGLPASWVLSMVFSSLALLNRKEYDVHGTDALGDFWYGRHLGRRLRLLFPSGYDRNGRRYLICAYVSQVVFLFLVCRLIVLFAESQAP